VQTGGIGYRFSEKFNPHILFHQTTHQQTNKSPIMSRIPTTTSTAFKAIAKASKLTVQHVRTLHKQGLPLDVTEALVWLSARENTAPESTAEKLRLKKLELLEIQRQKTALDLDAQKGRMISREEANAHMVKIGSALASFIARAIAEIPSITEGLPRHKAAPLVKARLRELQTKFADSNSEFWKEHPEKTDSL
jgi:hypothetical protein